MIFTATSKPLEAGERVARIVLGTIDERQKSRKRQVVLVIGRSVVRPSAARVATAITRAPAANCASSTALGF